MKLRYFLIIFLSVFLLGCSGTSGLLDLKNEMDGQKKIYNIQKSNFRKVSLAIKSNKLQEGLDAGYIKSKYGEPVTVISGKEKNLSRWVYTEDTFKIGGPRVYLYFSPQDQLVSWQNVE
ncbi:MAG: hypothetical protein V1674_03805 [Candidatus Omnitrophota bacterium]